MAARASFMALFQSFMDAIDGISFIGAVSGEAGVSVIGGTAGAGAFGSGADGSGAAGGMVIAGGVGSLPIPFSVPRLIPNPKLALAESFESCERVGNPD